MYSPSIHVEVYFFIGTDLDKCSITSLAHHWILCSEWVPSLVLLDFFHWCFMIIYLYLGQIKIPIKTLMMYVFLTNIQLFISQDINRWTGVMGVIHSLFLRGQEWGGGGGGGRHVTHSSQQHLCSIYFFLFIQNIPKRINYIMKYFDSHLYRLWWSILGDGLIM